jgi:hypothetical protein
MVLMKCYECGQEAQNAKGLSYHVRMKHGKAYPDYLVEHEMGGTWPLCGCGCEQRVKFLCGKFCAHVRGHQSIGLKRSDDTRRRISEVQQGVPKSTEANAKRSASMLDYHSKHNNVRDAVKKHLIGSKRSEESKRKQGVTRKAMFASGDLVINREKISNSITKLYLEGGFQWATGQYTSDKMGFTINYRSSWELKYAQMLDADDAVEAWQYEPFAIPYVLEKDGPQKQYVPDFLIRYSDGHTELVEVKPKELVDTKTNVAKCGAALALCELSGWTYVFHEAQEFS